jgi:hypothetical protein
LNLSRRRLIFTGVAGAAVLVAARWLQPSHSVAASALSADAANVMRAIIPALLNGALPDDATERRAAIEHGRAVGTAIAGLPPLPRRIVVVRAARVRTRAVAFAMSTPDGAKRP